MNKFKKNDKIIVISGKDRGRTGIIDNVLKNATADNIESSLECFSLLVEKLNEAKRKFDLEAPKHPRACKSSKIWVHQEPKHKSMPRRSTNKSV